MNCSADECGADISAKPFIMVSELDQEALEKALESWNEAPGRVLFYKSDNPPAVIRHPIPLWSRPDSGVHSTQEAV